MKCLLELKVQKFLLVTNFLINENVVLQLQSARSIEAAEEAKLKARFPQGMVGRPAAGHSAFLQKRLGKGVRKYN